MSRIRNPVYNSVVPWVRIPPSPPEKRPRRPDGRLCRFWRRRSSARVGLPPPPAPPRTPGRGARARIPAPSGGSVRCSSVSTTVRQKIQGAQMGAFVVSGGEDPPRAVACPHPQPLPEHRGGEQELVSQRCNPLLQRPDNIQPSASGGWFEVPPTLSARNSTAPRWAPWSFLAEKILRARWPAPTFLRAMHRLADAHSRPAARRLYTISPRRLVRGRANALHFWGAPGFNPECPCRGQAR